MLVHVFIYVCTSSAMTKIKMINQYIDILLSTWSIFKKYVDIFHTQKFQEMYVYIPHTQFSTYVYISGNN